MNGPGPIPWRDIREYAIDSNLEPDVKKMFEQVIRQMDHGYLKWKSDNAPKPPNRGNKTIKGRHG